MARGSEKSDAIEACAILTKIHGERGLLERASCGVLALDDDAERFGNARFLAGAAPEAGERLLESKANAAFALGVFVHVGDADLLFRSGDAIDQSDGISDGELCLEKNKCSAGVDQYGFRFFLEGTARGAKAVDGDRDVQTHAWAGAGRFF